MWRGREKALRETRCRYRQAMGAGRQRLSLGLQRLPLPVSQAHPVSPLGQPLGVGVPQSTWSCHLAAMPGTALDCKRGCSPQPGPFKGNHLLLGVQSLPERHSFPQISCGGLFLCFYVGTPCPAFEAAAPLKEQKSVVTQLLALMPCNEQLEQQ